MTHQGRGSVPQDFNLLDLMVSLGSVRTKFKCRKPSWCGSIVWWGKKNHKKLSHTKRSEVREVLLSQQKIEEYFFFPKQALKRSKSETQGSGCQTLECFGTNLQDLTPQLVDSICRVCDSVGLEEQVLT